MIHNIVYYILFIYGESIDRTKILHSVPRKITARIAGARAERACERAVGKVSGEKIEGLKQISRDFLRFLDYPFNLFVVFLGLSRCSLT
jgi:hypothetical protein